MEPSDITSDYSFIIHQLDEKIASSHQKSNPSSIVPGKHSSNNESNLDVKKLKFSDNHDFLNTTSFINDANDTNDISINSTSIKYQTQIDEYKIQVEKYKEELHNAQDELETYKHQTTRQLIFLEENNTKLKKESEQRLEKYYEEKKNWQVKIRELEYQNQQLLKKNSDKTQPIRTSEVNSSVSANSSDKILQKLAEFQQELEQERLQKMKLASESKEFEKTILELNHKIKLLESSVRTSGDDELEIKLLRKSNNELNLVINKQKKDLEKLTSKISNQELLEEEISSLNNKLKLNQDIVKDYNNIQVEYSKLNEEKNKWKNIFQSIVDANQEMDSSLAVNDFSPATVINMMNNLQEKYLQARTKETTLTLKLDSTQSELNSLVEESKKKDEKLTQLENSVQNLYINIDIVKKQNELYLKENGSIKFLLESYEKEFSHGKSPDVTQIVTEKNKVIESLTNNYNELATSLKELETKVTEKINKSDPVLSSLSSIEDKYKSLKDNFLELQEISGVDLLPSNTKVLRYTMNPSNKLFKSKETQESSYPGDVIDNLRKKIHDLKESKDIANPAPVAVEVKSTKQDPPADLYDPQKRIQRLKDIFLEKTSKFRQAVCLLTGYKMDMLPTDPNDPSNKTRIRLRSIYASSPDDDLLFLINDDQPELLETQFTKSIDPTTMIYLTNYNSVPGFLSTITLQLFENQTYLG